MTARRSRRRSAAYAALALGLAGSLALTGCNSHSKKSKKSSSSSTSKSKKRKIIGSGGGAAAGAGAASRRAFTCTPGTYSVEFQEQATPSHVVVRFRNNSSRPCKLYNAPVLRFGSSKTPLPFLEGNPSALGHKVTVPSHGEAYASIPTATAATKGTAQTVVNVEFMGISLDSHRRGPVRIDFPKNDPVSVGKSKVTNWYSSISRAEIASDSD
ncbi:DUF4232 domain-containing protein [Streptomyces sp. NPDC017993]|uniref:DUF4232 domain-containing protein n=1 Tax=Streptomyces sp. NPDC017993 TaxID=3365027 RepID=UPI0037A937B1